MTFESLSQVLDMGGHGLYVWLSYGVTLLVVLANVISVRRARNGFLRAARSMAQRRRAAGVVEPTDNPEGGPLRT